jgi:hypothetical protein
MKDGPKRKRNRLKINGHQDSTASEKNAAAGTPRVPSAIRTLDGHPIGASGV